MDINKALTIAKNLENHFRVFQELNEFMQQAVALQNVVKEFEDAKAALEADISKLESSRSIFIKDMENLKRKKDAEFSQRESDLGVKIATRQAEIEADIRKMEVRRNAAMSSLKEAVEAHDLKMTQISDERQKAEETLKAVQKKIKDIRAKLE